MHARLGCMQLSCSPLAARLHRRTGLASYMNVAATDPLQAVGLVAFDDEELSAPPVRDAVAQLLQGADEDASVMKDASTSTAAAAAAELLYVVAFSRNCTGAVCCVLLCTCSHC